MFTWKLEEKIKHFQSRTIVVNKTKFYHLKCERDHLAMEMSFGKMYRVMLLWIVAHNKVC